MDFRVEGLKRVGAGAVMVFSFFCVGRLFEMMVGGLFGFPTGLGNLASAEDLEFGFLIGWWDLALLVLVLAVSYRFLYRFTSRRRLGVASTLCYYMLLPFVGVLLTQPFKWVLWDAVAAVVGVLTGGPY